MPTGSVYKIWSPSSDDIYIGSTKQTLSSRMSGHRSSYKAWTANNSRFCSSYGVLRFSDARIELLELVEFTTRPQLTAREGHWIRSVKCLNKHIAGRTQAEYKKDNAVKINEWVVAHHVEVSAYKAKYDASHRVENRERHSKKIECACGRIHRRDQKSKHVYSAKHMAFLEELHQAQQLHVI